MQPVEPSVHCRQTIERGLHPERPRGPCMRGCGRCFRVRPEPPVGTPDRAMAARRGSPCRELRHPLDKLDGTAGQVMVAESGGMRLGGACGRARAAVPEA